MSVDVDYSRIDGRLAEACDDTPADECSLAVFVHTLAPPDAEQSQQLSEAGVSVPVEGRKIFTATLSPAQVATLSHQPWIKHLKLSQRLRPS